MKEPVVVLGMGEMGRVFAAGFLRTGHPVFPVTRDMDLDREATLIPGPELVLVAVGDADLHVALDGMPEIWRDRVCLLQNELLPRDWRDHRIVRPTVVTVWFEKRRGREVRLILPSPVYGPKAELILDALGSLEIPAVPVAEAGEMLYEMVRKNLYILTSNVAGLVVGGTVGGLWNEHAALAREIGREVLDVQEWLVRESLHRDRLLQGMVEGFQADPEHECLGRTARARLERLVRAADEAGLATPRLRAILAGG